MKEQDPGNQNNLTNNSADNRLKTGENMDSNGPDTGRPGQEDSGVPPKNNEGQPPPSTGREEDPSSPEDRIDILTQAFGSGRRAGAQEKVIKFQNILADEDLIRVMKEPTLGSGTKEMTKLKAFMDIEPDVNNYDEYGALAETVIESDIEVKGKEFLYEWLLEKIIGASDKADEYTEYNPGSYPVQYSLDALRVVAQKAVAEEKMSQDFFSYMEQLKHIRPMAHKIHLLATYGKGFDDFLAEGHLRSNSLDFMYEEIAGLKWVKMQYEKMFGGRAGETHTVLSHGDVEQLKVNMTEHMNQANTLGLLDKEGRELLDWELTRALRMGLSFFEGTQRAAVYSGLGNMPPSSGTVERISSSSYLYITRKMYNVKEIAVRFFADSTRPGSRFLIRNVFKTIVETGNNKEKGKEKYLGLFGVDKRTEAMNGYGAQDMETHSWRLQELFFGNIRFLNKDGENVNLLNELISFARKNDPSKSEGDILGGESLKKKGQEALSEEFEHYVLGQRLYLSALSRYGNFTPELKAKIFQKIAILKPSSMAAMFPELVESKDADDNFTGEFNPAWEGLKKILYLAELERVRLDADRQTLWGDYLKDSNKFKNELKELGKKDSKDLTEKEKWKKEVMQEIVDDKYFQNELDRFNNSSAEITNGEGDYAFQMVKRCKQMVDKLNKSIDKENEGKENEKDKKTNISWSVGEEELLKKIIKEGFEKAGPLSNAKLSHSVFIDDAPVENWKKTGEGHVGLSDEDMLRILISDQKNLVEACGGLNHLLESPQIFKTFSDGLTTFVEKWGEVHGRESAQELVDPVIRAWMNMAKTETWILWTPGAKMIMDWLRKPTSHMEEYYRLSKISMDEEDVYNSLKALAQANIISDNSFEKAEKEAKELEKVKDNPGKKIEPQYTQFELLSKDLGASKKKRSLRMLRFIALVFGPAFVKALFGNATKDM